MKRDPNCQGVRSWINYCEEFQTKWTEQLEMVVEELENTDTPRVPGSKYEETLRELQQYKKMNSDLKGKLAETDNLREEVKRKDEVVNEMKERLKVADDLEN